jgi:hypothetical protein
LSQFRNTCVPGCAKDLANFRALSDFPHKGMLTPSATDDQHLHHADTSNGYLDLRFLLPQRSAVDASYCAQRFNSSPYPMLPTPYQALSANW